MKFIIAICPRCRSGTLFREEDADDIDGRECACGKFYTREKYRVTLEAEPIEEPDE